MNLPETKSCPRCSNPFECKPGNITQCQCFGMKFTAAEKAFIEQRYSTCLCSSCLEQLKNQAALFMDKFIYRK